MSSTQHLHERIAALRADARAVGELVAAEAAGMSAEELFEVTGELQGAVNAAEGAQLLAAAHAAAHETRLTDRGPVEVHHALGFVDAMAPTEVSLATGTGQWAAGRRVSLAATLSERFPLLLGAVLTGDVACGTATKVVAVCDGLDATACAAVEAVLVPRLADLDPARVTTTARRIATRVAADQVRTAHTRNRRDRCVQVSPGPDGTTTWWAQIPAATSAAAWSAITTLADTYAVEDPSLTTDQARADAFTDLLLTNVRVHAKVTLGIPVITDAPSTRPEPAVAGPPARSTRASTAGTGTRVAADAGVPTRPRAGVIVADDDREAAIGCQGLGSEFRISTALTGCELPGLGFIDADTIETLLTTVPLDVGRALLDARTGTLLETTTTVYRPPKAVTDFVTIRDGTCRMWGCTRPATTCDIDHTRPWPAGPTTPANLADLCRRHHRLKQRRRWTYSTSPDGTVTWTSPTGKARTTPADHATWPPPATSPPTTQAVSPPPPPAVRELAAVAPPPF
jgi:hypothetical protein